MYVIQVSLSLYKVNICYPLFRFFLVFACKKSEYRYSSFKYIKTSSFQSFPIHNA